MTAEGKLLKLSSLAALFVGLGSLVFGLVLALGTMVDVDAWVTAGEGLVAMIYGVRTAILANVPSNTSKIKIKALALTVLAAAVVGFFVYLGARQVQMPQICLAVLVCVIAVAAFVIASRIVKEQLRK
ncbi:MAG: hypothetical protein IKG11_08690 [Atopobiaceae bacterium]|nr:hypothetical protein [Atopobiaceae bacterium]MDO4405299.1 hypothetical protein [Atopobiaceae bacterium]